MGDGSPRDHGGVASPRLNHLWGDPLSVREEDVELLLQIARDASTGSTFQDRLSAIGDTLSVLIPNSTLSAVVVRPDLSGPSSGPDQAYMRNAELNNVLMYAEHYMQDDPGPPVGLENLGTPFALSDLVPSSKRGADAYTGEFLPHVGIAHTLGMALQLPNHSVLSFCLQRETGARDFSRRDKAVLRLSGPDLSRAVYGSILRQQLQQVSEPGVNGDSGAGTLFLSGLGEVLQADPRAVTLERELGSAFPMDALIQDAQRLVQTLRPNAQQLRLFPAPDRRVLRTTTTVLQLAPEPRLLVLLELVTPELSPQQRFDAFAEEHGLTNRERQVAQRAIEGAGNQGIGFELGISAVTVNVHLGKVYRKTGVTNRTELARLFGG